MFRAARAMIGLGRGMFLVAPRFYSVGRRL
jgi:hypothetical protein